jgi:lactate permease
MSGLGLWAALLAVILLGAIGGFATGSGVTGNALFMPSAAATGESMGTMAMFAALQNGASGHVAMAALPVAAILLSALDKRTPEDDRTVMRLGLSLAAVHVVVLAASGAFWIWWTSR